MKKQNSALGRLCLLGCTFLWGTSFVVLKNALDDMPTLWILAIRFTGAAALMALFGLNRLKQLTRLYWKHGAVMGLFLAVAYIIQTFGLVYTTPGKNAFLTATYCVMVPFLWWVIRRQRPEKKHVFAAVICFVGMGLVSLQGNLNVNPGDVITIGCGLFYGLHIVATSSAAEGRDPLLLSMVQFLTAAVICWILAPLVSPFPEAVPTGTWLGVGYLCVMCTGVCFLLQTIGQKYTPPSEVAIILTLEAVFGAIISVLFYHEQLTLRVLCGFALIFLAILICEAELPQKAKKTCQKAG